MADSLFQFVAGKLEERTRLDKLEARGTVRLALKEAGLEPRGVTVEQMSVMLEKAMAKELVARGVADAEEVCRGLVQSVKDFDGDQPRSTSESPEDVFRRLGGR